MKKVHFLQSTMWKKFQDSLGTECIEHTEKEWSYRAYKGVDKFGVYFYAPYGPTAASKEAFSEAIVHMKLAAKKAGAYEVVIEPVVPDISDQFLKQYGDHVTSRQPRRNLVIDLNRPAEDILADMTPTRRNEYRNFEKKGIVVRKSYDPADIKNFVKFLHATSAKKKFFSRDTHFFEVMAQELLPTKDIVLFVGSINDIVESVILAYDDEDTRYYAFLGRDPDARGVTASSPALATAIFDAKEQGKKYFDLFGISDTDDVQDEKAGYTKYKRSFGGVPHEYAGTWEISLDAKKSAIKKVYVAVKKVLGRH